MRDAEPWSRGADPPLSALRSPLRSPPPLRAVALSVPELGPARAALSHRALPTGHGLSPLPWFFCPDRVLGFCSISGALLGGHLRLQVQAVPSLPLTHQIYPSPGRAESCVRCFQSRCWTLEGEHRARSPSAAKLHCAFPAASRDHSALVPVPRALGLVCIGVACFHLVSLPTLIYDFTGFLLPCAQVSPAGAELGDHCPALTLLLPGWLCDVESVFGWIYCPAGSALLLCSCRSERQRENCQ